MATFLDADQALEALLKTFLDPVLRNISPYGCPMGAEGVVSRQMEAVGWVYNKYLCREFPNLVNLDWEELCQRATKERPKLLRFITTTKEESSCSHTITEYKVKNACESVKFVNTHNNEKTSPVTKISVCVLNPRLDKCVMALGASTMGVWSFIEKEIPLQYMEEDQLRDSEEDCVFKAVLEQTGIKSHVLRIGGSFLVGEDINKPGCCSKFYIVLSNGTFDLSSRVKMENIDWIPLSATLSKADGPLVELTDDAIVQTTSAVQYFRLRPFCPFIKNWLVSHREMELKLVCSRSPVENLGCCKANGNHGAMLSSCKSIVLTVSEPNMKQGAGSDELVAKKEDTKSTFTCDHSQNQKILMDASENGMKASTEEDKFTSHQQTPSTQSLTSIDTIMPPDAFSCQPQPTSRYVLPDDMISRNDACVHAELAAIVDSPMAENIEEHQIHKHFIDFCKEVAPLKNKISEYSPETEKGKKQTSPLNKCPKASIKAMKSFENYNMDKDTPAFNLNKALHIVWKKRKAMCKELRDLHSRVNALHEKIVGCDSNLATLIGGGRSGLQLAVRICKIDSGDCLGEDVHEAASLPTDVFINGEQQSSKKRTFQLLTNSAQNQRVSALIKQLELVEHVGREQRDQCFATCVIDK